MKQDRADYNTYKNGLKKSGIADQVLFSRKEECFISHALKGHLTEKKETQTSNPTHL
jgi:hypothetical protein